MFEYRMHIYNCLRQDFVLCTYLEVSIKIRLRFDAPDEVLTDFSNVSRSIQQRLTRLQTNNEFVLSL